eukprot:849601_1
MSYPSFHSFVVVSVLISIATCQTTMDPTSVSPDGKTQYFIASDISHPTRRTFGYAQIMCSTEICHIVCDKTGGCQSTDVNVDPSTTTLTVLCPQEESCSHTKIWNADTVASIDIECTYNASTSWQTGACTSLELYARDSGSTSIYCTEHNCRWLDLYLDNAVVSLTAEGVSAITSSQIRATSVNTNCMTDDTCDSNEIYCPSDGCDMNCTSGCSGTTVYVDDPWNDIINLHCADNTSCNDMSFDCVNTPARISAYSWNAQSLQYECESFLCCPFVKHTESCGATDCEIDCSGQSCGGVFIDGSSANTLLVNCTGDNACEGAKVECPTGSTANCIIDCPDSRSCQYMTVVSATADAMNLFEMNCAGVQSYICFHAYVVLNAATINTVDIDCGRFGCHSASFVFGDLIKDLNMICSESRACSNTQLQAKIENTNFNINCDATEACGSSIFTLEFVAPDSRFDITCIDADSIGIFGGGCEGAAFHVTGAQSTQLTMNCTGEKMCESVAVHGYELSAMNVSCNGEYSCFTGTFDAQLSDSFHLDCTGSYSCNRNSVYCPYHNIGACDIDCGAAGHTCDRLYIHVPSSLEYVYQYLDLTCESQVNGTVDALNTCTGSAVYCDDGVRSTVAYEYNHTMDQYQCSNVGDAYCCPYWKGPSSSPTTATPSGSPIVTTHPSVSPITMQPSAAPIQPSASPITLAPSGAPVTVHPSASPITSKPSAPPSGAPVTMQPSVSPITVEPSVSQSTAAPTTPRPTASPITGHPSEPTEPTASPSTKSIIGTNHTI